MAKVFSSREVIQRLKEDSWYEVRVTGSHIILSMLLKQE